MKNFLIFFITLSVISCEINEEISNSEWIFIACEGNYGASNGSVYKINSFGEIDSIPNLGDVVQSVEVHENKLFVLLIIHINYTYLISTLKDFPYLVLKLILMDLVQEKW